MLICKKPIIFNTDLIAAAMLLIILTVSWWASENLLNAHIEKSHQKYNQFTQKQKQLEQELSKLEKLDHQQQTLALTLSNAPDILAQNQGLPEVIRQLGTLSQRHQLAIDEITPGPAIRDTYFAHHEINLSGKIAYPDFYRFAFDLNQKMPYLRIASWNMTLPDAATSCDLQLKLHMYRHHD